MLYLLGERHAVEPRQQDISVHAGEGVGIHGTTAGQRLPDDDNGAGVAIGKRIASAHGVEVGRESANIVPRHEAPVAAAKAFVGDREGDGLIHLEERHGWVARIVLEFAHDAMIASLNDFFAYFDVGKRLLPEHVDAGSHVVYVFLIKRIGIRFAFIVVKCGVTVHTFPLFP